MNINEATVYLEQAAKYGSVLGLDNMKELLKRLGNPQQDLPTVHIAGTNGKGSVLAFLSTILTEAGYKVGRYISPTILEYRERIQIGTQMIEEESLAELVSIIKDAICEMEKEGGQHPTLFEIETAMAFLYFKKEKCDLVVLETGLGGATDATNVIENTLLTIFTSISMDHMAFLGETIEEIATIKSGILKKGCVAVSACQKPGVRAILMEEAKKKEIPLTFVAEDEVKDVSYTEEKQIFSYKKYSRIEISLLGLHQLENAALVMEALEQLDGLGFPVTQEAMRRGFVNTIWLGRLTTLSKQPRLLIDGAHNPDGAKRLAQSLEFYFPDREFVYIMGVLKDKEYDKIAQIMAPKAKQIFTISTPDAKRSLGEKELAETVRAYNPKVKAVGSVEEALTQAVAEAEEEDVIVAFGSLSYLGELIRCFQTRKQMEETRL